MEFNNTLTLVVANKATKDGVKEEFEKIFGVKVAAVRTYNTPKGQKRAVVRLAKEVKMDDIAAKLKLV